MKCMYCSKEFKSKQGLEKHIQKSICQRKKCRFCQKKFSNAFNKNNHEANRVCLKEKKIFQCADCSKILSSNQRLKSHKEVCGTEDYEFNKLSISFRKKVSCWSNRTGKSRTFFMNLLDKSYFCYSCDDELDEVHLKEDDGEFVLVCSECFY